MSRKEFTIPHHRKKIERRCLERGRSCCADDYLHNSDCRENGTPFPAAIQSSYSEVSLPKNKFSLFLSLSWTSRQPHHHRAKASANTHRPTLRSNTHPFFSSLSQQSQIHIACPSAPFEQARPPPFTFRTNNGASYAALPQPSIPRTFFFPQRDCDLSQYHTHAYIDGDTPHAYVMFVLIRLTGVDHRTLLTKVHQV